MKKKIERFGFWGQGWVDLFDTITLPKEVVLIPYTALEIDLGEIVVDQMTAPIKGQRNENSALARALG